ncbi:MAG TPA: hypothetical protein VF306_00555 [Pirellulales bacterium]
MAMTFDATLKDMARESPHGVLAAFDRPPTLPLRLLNVDLSTVTRAADLAVGLGEPLQEIVHLEFQASAAAWKHADLMAYNALLYDHHHVPVHTILILLRPQAAHSNLDGRLSYAARPGRGKMEFEYEVVRLWERPAEDLLAGDLAMVPLAVLGRLPELPSLQEGLGAVAQRVVERLTSEAPPEQAKRLLTETLLLTGLRVRRDVAITIFRGVRMMEESDTYLMILEQGEERGIRESILVVGEERFGACDEATRERLSNVGDLNRLKRMHRRAVKAASWQEILNTP